MTYLVTTLVVLGIAALVVAIEKFLKHNPNKAKVIDKAGTEIGKEAGNRFAQIVDWLRRKTP